MVHIDPADFEALRYDFTYAGSTGPLETVTAPSVDGVSRVVQRDVLGDGRVDQHTDPDGSTVEFGFANGSVPEQITSRTNRRGVVQSFAFDATGKLVTVRVPLNASDTAVTTFCPAESRGFVSTGCSSGPLHPDSAVTVMDGPRPDVTDVTTFRLDHFGAPRLIRDALANETQLFRGNRDFPGLVTRLVHANGWVNDAFHDQKGLITKLVQYAPLGPGQDAVTDYTWDPKWERVTSITFPERNVLQFAYDSTTGNRLWQQDGRGLPSRVDFTYYGSGVGNSQHLLASITYPADPANVRARDTLLYDALGNAAEQRTAVGTTSQGITQYASDSIGRLREVRVSIDTTGAQQVDSTSYDIMGRVILTKGFGPAVSGAPAMTLFARTDYDEEGNVRRVRRWGSPDPTAIDTITSRMGYDLADRAVADTAPDLAVEVRAYDRAGNVTAVTTRRGHTLSMEYDALNRLAARVVPSVTYADTAVGLGAVDTTSFPRRPNSGTDYVIAADTETFAYDALGRVTAANNRDARVTRTYFANGLTESERLEVRNARSTTLGHDYLTEYGYDLNGRRTLLRLPSQLTTGTADSIAFAYDDTTSELRTIRDPLGRDYTYGYTLRGEPRTLTMPGQYEERWAYFPDGMLRTDSIKNTGATTGGRVPFSTLRASSFTYDRRGKRLTADDAWGYQEINRFAYTGLGYVTSSYIRQNAFLVTGGGTASTVFRTREALAYDALGNLDSALTLDSVRINSVESSNSRRGRNATYQANVGRLLQEASGEGAKTYVYDPSGNLELSIREEANGPGQYPRENRFTYYGADERVRAVDARSGFPGDVDLQLKKWTFEEYRYDALGRRVWVQSDRECAEERDGQPLEDEWLECSVGTLRRTVWDGAQELFEIQVPYRLPGGQPQPDSVLENDAYLAQLPHFGAGRDPNPYFGRVLYVHGLALDQPVAVVRYNYVDFFNTTVNRITFPPTSSSLFWNALGKLGPVVCGDGQTDCTLTSGGRTATMGMDVPSSWFVLDRPKFAGARRFFQGTLTADKQDATGVLFRRNRYYDPSTGRFTQEDPIGLAGGLNLYGFAAGDPVNFSDPFGLCVGPAIAFCPQIVAALSAAGIGLAAWLATRTFTIARPGEVFFKLGKEDDPQNEDEASDDPAGQVKNPDGSIKEAGSQFEEITEAQRRARTQGKGERIRSTGKSRQRDQQELEEEAERALEELRKRLRKQGPGRTEG
jgi:RHS repeat-associated protein